MVCWVGVLRSGIVRFSSLVWGTTRTTSRSPETVSPRRTVLGLTKDSFEHMFETGRRSGTTGEAQESRLHGPRTGLQTHRQADGRPRGRHPAGRRTRGSSVGRCGGPLPGGRGPEHGSFQTHLRPHPEPGQDGGGHGRCSRRRVLLVGDGPVVTGHDEPLPCPVHGGERRRGRGCRCRQQQGHNGRGRGPR